MVLKRRSLFLVSMLMVGLAMVTGLSASDGPEIPFADETPLIPNVTPVVIVSGSDYEMGYQYGQQLIQIFGQWIFKAPAIEPWISSERFGREFTSDEIEALKANQWYVNQDAPEMIDFMKGIADGVTDAGVPVSYQDVLAQFVYDKKYPNAPPESQAEELPPEECSSFAAWGSATKDGKLICATSSDGSFEFDAVIVAFPDTGNNFIWLPYTATFTSRSGHPGMNNKGLAYVHHGLTYGRGYPEEERGYGITRGIAVPHTLRFADDSIEAEEMLLAYQSAYGYVGGFWADVDGNTFAIENRNPKIIRRPGDLGETDFLYATNNFLSREMGLEGQVYIPHAGWLDARTRGAVTRNLELWNMLNYYQGQVDLEFTKAMWRYPGEPPEDKEAWARQICGLTNAPVAIMLPDDGDEGLFFVTAGRAGRVAYTSLGRGYYLPDALYTFYELKLASSPAEVTKAARGRAQNELYYANQELMKLNYTDPAYAPLKEIFDQAATEMFKGEYQRGLAQKTTGNESIYTWSKATRAFTRCQAFARHVYNALVPPPTTPQDLGLDPYGYWVGIPEE